MSVAQQLVRCNHKVSIDRICSLCGVYSFPGLHQHGTKTTRYLGTINDISLLRSSQSFVIKAEVKPLTMGTIQALQKVQKKLELSIQTLALGIYLYYSVLDSENQTGNVGISLCVAAKLLEHTNKKTQHKFRKYFKKIYNKEQYLDKEAHILTTMNFDLKIVTFVDYLLNYLSKGGCFSSQIIDVAKFEDCVIRKAKQAIYNGTFMKFMPEQLAVSILYNCRSQTKMIQTWNWHLQQCTKVSANEANRWSSLIRPLLIIKTN